MEVPAVNSSDSNGDVLDVFGRHRDVVSLPVLENDRPMGLISRHIFMTQMSKPYHREIYVKKSCIAFMDKEPLIVDAALSIEKLATLAVQFGDKALADGFVIVRGDKFLGIGSGLDLMRMMVELQSEKNRQVMHSIDYASVIQRAMMSSSRELMGSALDDACLIWEPRDIVGGDFYHFEQFQDGWFAAVADCTGHGVPGAFLTLIASSVLTQALHRHGPRDPAQLMGSVNCGIKQALGQHSTREHLSESDDGMDAVFLWMDLSSRTLTYASAKMPIFLLPPDADDVQVLKGERAGLGYVGTAHDTKWTNCSLSLSPDTIVMTATDGIIDQIGGVRNIAYGKQRLTNALRQHRHSSMGDIAECIMAEHKTYQGEQHRRDDLTVFGFRAV